MYSNLKFNRVGGINGFLESGAESTLSIAECELAEKGEWGLIEDYTQSEKDALAAQQATDLIKQELAALDVPLHTLALAISGDAQALGKVSAAEAEKDALRAKL